MTWRRIIIGQRGESSGKEIQESEEEKFRKSRRASSRSKTNFLLEIENQNQLFVGKSLSSAGREIH
jgi:hypothetical protein